MGWGVVVATDQGAEWLLPWWWECYSRHHKQEVAFVDFGMSEEAKNWCQTKGLLIPFVGQSDFVKPKEHVGKKTQKRWEAIYGPNVWKARQNWFKKPLAMLHTPFQKSIWMDLDCEVCKPIDAVFEGINAGVLGAVRVEKRGHYNSGVIVYDKEASLLKAWADACLKKHGSCIGDETVLSGLIGKNRYLFKEIAPEFNWMMGWGYHPDLKIAHWAASWGKLCIETMGGIQNYITQCGEAREGCEVFSQRENGLFF
ncbi:MAG: hypothetical protein ACRDFB_02730 [Rhabdochlamydiaceae bacterium]